MVPLSLFWFLPSSIETQNLVSFNPDSAPNQLVSIHKWPFFAISASICGIACATYQMYASAQSLVLTRGVNAPRPRGQPAGCPISQCCEIALDLAKNSSFLDRKLIPVPITKRLIYGWAPANPEYTWPQTIPYHTSPLKFRHDMMTPSTGVP